MECGLSLNKEVLNGKWKSNLSYAISGNIQRPSEMQGALADATERLLNVQLKELEKHGIVGKRFTINYRLRLNIP